MSAPACPSGHYTYQSQLGVEVAPIVNSRHKVLLTGSAMEGWKLPVRNVTSDVTPVTASAALAQQLVFEEVTTGALVNLRSGKSACTLFYEVRTSGERLIPETNAQWFAIDEIPYQQISNPLHREVLQTWAAQQKPYVRSFVNVS